MKACSKCKVLTSLDNFRIDRKSKDGRQSKCKPCAKISDAEFRRRNVDLIKLQQQKHYAENSEKIKSRSRQWEKDNPEYVYLRKKEYREDNKSHIAEYHKRYSIRNRSRIRDYIANYRKTRLASDPDFQVSVSMQRILHRTIRQTTSVKNQGTFAVLGYTASELRDHLESLFQPGMTWSNRGEWHIDHVKPIVQFIEEGVSDPAIINALKNLQPLWAADNLSKGARRQ